MVFLLGDRWIGKDCSVCIGVRSQVRGQAAPSPPYPLWALPSLAPLRPSVQEALIRWSCIFCPDLYVGHFSSSFCHCIPHYHHESSLRQAPPLWYGSEGQVGLTGFSAQGLRRLKSKCCLAWAPVWRLWGRFCLQAHSSCWWDPVPCNWGTKGPVSLTRGPSIFKASNASCVLLLLPVSLTSSSACFEELL